ncbi:MAG TPA: sugar phosphate isomerase/epimerase [Chthoniobacterales bacterium]|jgi:sugar phosphate isomerase/epimerase|nr:sugar phosphate isomerase/epimerase [Chthoniobacterales bacterium]
MLAEIWELGFRRVELGHGVRLSLIQGIAEFARDHDLAITSLHNFCPLPLEVFHASPDCLQCTSSDAGERNRAQRHTFATIDHAVRFGAPYVVLHLGFAPVRDETKRLSKLIYQGKIFGRTFVQTKLRALKEREKADVYPRVRDWLVPVVEHAKQARIKLGIENRTELDTFPNEYEFKKLFDDFKEPVLGHWHDFGHAQVRENLTFHDHAEWLRAAAPRLFGCHVHDVIYPDRDHRVPLTGTVPFTELLPIIPAHAPLVWEVSPSAQADAIQTALEKWRELFHQDAGNAKNAA